MGEIFHVMFFLVVLNSIASAVVSGLVSFIFGIDFGFWQGCGLVVLVGMLAGLFGGKS